MSLPESKFDSLIEVIRSTSSSGNDANNAIADLLELAFADYDYDDEPEVVEAPESAEVEEAEAEEARAEAEFEDADLAVSQPADAEPELFSAFEPEERDEA